MRQLARLCRLRVLQQSPRRADGGFQAFCPEPRERGNRELLTEQAAR